MLPRDELNRAMAKPVDALTLIEAEAIYSLTTKGTPRAAEIGQRIAALRREEAAAAEDRCPACGAPAHWPEPRIGVGFIDPRTGDAVDDFGCSGKPDGSDEHDAAVRSGR